LTIDPTTFWSVAAALGTAFAAMGGFVRYQTVKLNRCNDARVKSLEDQLSLVKTAKKGTEPIVGGGT
jgi:hypothetical protein